MRVEDRSTSAPDLLATVCKALGIDALKSNPSNVGRPIRVVDKDARPSDEIVRMKRPCRGRGPAVAAVYGLAGPWRLSVRCLRRRHQPACRRPPRARSSPLESGLHRPDEPLQRLRIEVELDGRPLDEVWDETFHKLFADLDRDGDGFLSREEVRRAPSALRVRQLSWGLFFAAPEPPPWEELDRSPADGRVSFEELVDYYHRHGVGGVQVAVGRPPATDALTDALLHRLDRDGDGRVSKAEWQAAAESLHALDRNDDELIEGDELVPGLAYPGAFGATLLTPRSLDDPPSSLLDSFPFMRLPEGEPSGGQGRPDQCADELIPARHSAGRRRGCSTWAVAPTLRHSAW